MTPDAVTRALLDLPPCPPMAGWTPAMERTLLQQDDATLLGRGPRGFWSGMDADAVMLHRDWLRSGRLVYELDPDAEAQLADTSLHWPEEWPKEPRALVLRTLPRTAKGREGDVAWTGYYVLAGPMPDHHTIESGGQRLAPLPGVPCYGIAFLSGGYDAFARQNIGRVTSYITDPSQIDDLSEDERRPVRTLVNAVAALLDQRVSQVVAHPRHGRAGRDYQRHGWNVSTLRLSADGLHTWRTKLIGPADTASGGAHAAPCAHVCHAHTARYWMDLDAHPDIEPERDEEGRVIFRMTAKGRPLVAVQRPVREHVRGSGAATPRLTRVRMDG